ncbi:LexA family transcriptional regulator, partial [Fangia hongkongensis]
ILIKNIKKLILEYGINELELSKHIQIPQSTLNKLLTGNTKDPKITVIRKIADYFSTSIEQLYDDTTAQVNMGKKVAPIISWQECASFDYESMTQKKNTAWLPIEYENNGHVFVLKSKPVMEPRFPNNTHLVINTRVQPNDGDIIVVQYPNVADATVKIFSINGYDTYLYNLNQSEYSILSERDKVIGVLTESRFNYI